MDSTIVVAIIGAIEGIGVAIIGGLISRYTKQTDQYRKAREEKDRLREERDACLYDLMFATAGGTEVLLQAAHGDEMNGNVDDALSSIKKAKSECNHVFNRQAAKL